MKAIVKKKVIKDLFIEYSVGDIVQSVTTEEWGIVVAAIPEEDTYQIFFFNSEEIVLYNSEYICSQVAFHVPIDDISNIRRCYLDGDKVKSVPLTIKCVTIKCESNE